ncbi:MAG: TIGR04282 family arsenosugar biosynthesis glycosyltransferase, partial [Vicinamibacteria bacterium]
MSNRQGALVLFTLSPRADGKRKSLAPEVVAALISRVQSVSSAVEGVDLLVATPSQAPKGVSPGRHLRQRGRDFGESLRLAVEDAFDLGYRPVVVVGNDAPEISASYLTRAFEALASGVTKAVLGPASDGGYNLLGLSRPCAGVFDSIPWGSSRVCDLTESRLHREGFEVLRLETVSDVDDVRDLERLL